MKNGKVRSKIPAYTGRAREIFLVSFKANKMHKSRPNCTKLFGDVEHIHMDVCAKNLSYLTITYIIMSQLVVQIFCAAPCKSKSINKQQLQKQNGKVSQICFKPIILFQRLQTPWRVPYSLLTRSRCLQIVVRAFPRSKAVEETTRSSMTPF